MLTDLSHDTQGIIYLGIIIAIWLAIFAHMWKHYVADTKKHP